MLLAVFSICLTGCKTIPELPDVHTGFAATTDRITPALAIEIYEKDNIVADLGVGNDIVYTSVGYNTVEMLEITPFIGVGYAVDQAQYRGIFGIQWIKW